MKDLDFGYQQIAVGDAKGNKERLSMLPTSAAEALKTQLAAVKTLHLRDLADGFGGVQLPFALARKYRHADHEWAWQYVFPAAPRSRDPVSGIIRRYHLGEWILQKAVKHHQWATGLHDLQAESLYLYLRCGDRLGFH